MHSRASGSYRSITRRLFTIFIIFALVPVAVLSVVAVRYINNTSQEQVHRMLDSEVEAFGDIVLGRLSIASRRLGSFARTRTAGNGNVSDEISWVTIAATGEAEARFAHVPASWMPRGLEFVEHLAAGRTLAVVRESETGPTAYLLRAVNESAPGAGLVAIELDEDFLLGAPETRNLTLDHCIYDSRARLLYATTLSVCKPFARWRADYRGAARERIGERSYYANWRHLFLREQFLLGDWRTSVVSADADVLRASELFTSNFVAFAILAFLCLSLASVYLIRRRMAPLNSIMAGIERVAQRDYARPVDVASGDEFEAMASAFNKMSQRVSTQIATMGSMSEIDQLILSRGKKEDILRIVLDRARYMLNGDRFALFLPDEEDARLCFLDGGAEGELASVAAQLPEDESRQLLRAGITQCAAGDSAAPGFLTALGNEQSPAYRLVPVTMEERLAAVLVIGISDSAVFDEEEQQLAASFADRIAVALANAEWEEKLFQQANYDTLTGLPNRPALIEALSRRIAAASREGLSFGVIFIDLDNFKLVNDSLGHDTGDRLIAAIAERIAECLRDDDIVARLGGDEFIIVSSECASTAQTIATMNGIATRVLDAVGRSVRISGQEIRGSASVGIALFPRDGDSASELMKNADVAMYHAKSEAPGRYQFFSAELNAQAMELMALSTELKTALENNEFILYYQPKFATHTRELRGAEALIRWEHPQRGLLTPGAFIDAAETLGLINAIGEWALKEVCRQIEAWRRAGHDTVPISVNIAPSQIQQGAIVEQISTLLERHELAGPDLELEITERVLLRRVDETIRTLNDVRALGVAISIDDYGTGYSSLSYMKHLPVNKLKIDGSFIADIDTDAADQAIVSSAILLARRLGMTVIAEGVETEQQALVLSNYGCDEVQGYHFSRPLAAATFIRLVDKNGPAAATSAPIRG